MVRLYSIQALRGLAALFVLLFHAGAISTAKTAYPTRQFGAFWEQGYAGVDLFFVISGFVMVYVTQNKTPSLQSAGRFLYARITRIYPLWWVYAGLMMVYFFMAYGQIAPPDRISEEAITPYIIKSLLLWPQTHFPVLSVGWTLIHEMLFYGLFAISLLGPRRLLPLWLSLWALLAIGASLAASPANLAFNLPSLISSPLSLEFIMGAFAALLFIHRKGKVRARYILTVSFFTLFYVFSTGFDTAAPNFIWKRIFGFGLPATLLVYALTSMERAQQIRAIPSWAVKLGDWSYSLYLSHILVLLALRRIWQIATPYLPEPLRYLAPGAADNLVFVAIAIFAAISFSYLSYKWIEQPLLKAARQKPPEKLS